MLKRFFDWLLDVDNCRSHPPLVVSMTGEILVRSTGGLGFYSTEFGRRRAGVSHAMMLGNNAEVCKNILKGEFDYCLTSNDKARYIQDIQEAVRLGGEYRDVKHDSKGHLYFPKGYWSKSDLDEILFLLGEVIMYYNGQHAFDHSCVYHHIEHGRSGEVLLDQYLVFTLSCFYKIGRNGLTKSSIGKFTTNVSLDIVGKTYLNEYGYLFERCNHPVGFFKKQRHSVNLVNNAALDLGTSDANIYRKLHEYCAKLASEILDRECRFTDREFFYTTFNGIKLVDLHEKYPISPFAIEVMKKEYDNDAAMLSTFNLLATQKRELDKANHKPINPKEESVRAMSAAASMNGGPNSYIDGNGVYHSNPDPVTSTLDWARGL